MIATPTTRSERNAAGGVHRAGVERNVAIHDGPFRAPRRGAGQKKTTTWGFTPGRQNRPFLPYLSKISARRSQFKTDLT